MAYAGLARAGLGFRLGWYRPVPLRPAPLELAIVDGLCLTRLLDHGPLSVKQLECESIWTRNAS